MADFPLGPYGLGRTPDEPPGGVIQPIHDADDTQPQRNPEAHNNRRYIPADWAPAGEGEGAPKLSGGVEVDIRTGATVGRGLNRKNQRYELTSTELQARRAATAAAEYAATSVCLGAEGVYEVRGPSGNCYDVSPNLVTCDCPDWYKQEQTGYGIVRCKHIIIVITALNDSAYPFGLPWGVSKMAEALGIAERTVQHLCQEGEFVAYKVNNNWHIAAEEVEGALAMYRAKMWPWS